MLNCFFIIFTLLNNIFLLVNANASEEFCYRSRPTWVMGPHLCSKHLLENSNTESSFQELAQFLHLIPKAYYIECKECPRCHKLVLKRDNLCKNCKFYSSDNFFGNKETWIKCAEPTTWDSNYFRKENRLYFQFFLHFLKYCSENSHCKCYWPERHSQLYPSAYFTCQTINSSS